LTYKKRGRKSLRQGRRVNEAGFPREMEKHDNIITYCILIIFCNRKRGGGIYQENGGTREENYGTLEVLNLIQPNKRVLTVLLTSYYHR